MNHVTESDLNPWRDPDDLLQALYRVGEPDPELRDSIARLFEHNDPDIREEALRILLTRWKDRSFRSQAVNMLRLDAEVMVRSAAAFGMASVSTEASRAEDTRLLLEILLDVRSAAYDALLILYRNPAFPTKRRDFDPAADVDWQWIGTLRTAVGNV
jgi:HEAT repeat protein